MIRIFSVLLLTVPLFSSTLDGLIAHAMENSTVVKKSQAEIELSKANLEESTSAHYGSIDLVASYTHFNLPRTQAPLTPASIIEGDYADIPTTDNLFGTGVMYSVPLFTGFAQTRQVEMDAIATQVSQSKLSLTKEQLVFNVASLYLTILSLQDMTNAQIKHVETLRQLEEMISNEVEFGKKPPIDLLKAKNDLQGNVSYLVVLKGNIAITKASLASLVGMDRIGSITPIKVSVKKPSYSINRLLGESDSLNKVIIADLNLKKAAKGIEKSESSLLPQVDLNSYYGYNYGKNDSTHPRAGDFEDTELWNIGVSATWKIFDFGKRDAVTQQAKIANIKAELDKHQILLDLKKSLIEASEQMKQEYANYQSNVTQLTLAKKSETIENVRYNNGVSTINDLLYAKSQTHIATAKLIESKYNYRKGKFYMDYLLERGVR